MKMAVWLGGLAVALILGALALLALRGSDDTAGEAGSGRLRIVATTSLIADAARSIGGDAVEVEALMGPGVDPHLYKASAGDVERLRRADIVLYNGLHLEGKLGEVLDGLRTQGRRPVAVAERVAPERRIAVGEGMWDPHIWFDVALWGEALQAIPAAIAAASPALVTDVGTRAVQVMAELAALDEEVRAALAVVPPERRVLVTAHDAFGYFGRAYGFEVTGLLGLSTAAEAGTGDVQRLVDLVTSRRLPAVFVETTVPVRVVEAIRDGVLARGHQVRIGGSLYSDALGDADGPAGTYVGMVRENVRTIVSALTVTGDTVP
jgi:manganese/zinc/iron transport system substrate-binding protein